MDWQRAIQINQEALLRIVTALIALAGLNAQQVNSMVPRSLRSNILSVLRPAESATRRLIVIMARGLKAKPHIDRGPVPDFETLANDTKTRIPAFQLYDPRKRFNFEKTKQPLNKFMPRISVPGLFSGTPTYDLPTPSQQTTVNINAIANRLLALQTALKNLPDQAKRLAQLQAKRNFAPAGPKRVPPLRPGTPPGYRKRTLHEIDLVLRECHGLARDALEKPT